MNDLKIFKNKEFGNLRAVEIDGVPWFAGKKVTGKGQVYFVNLFLKEQKEVI